MAEYYECMLGGRVRRQNECYLNVGWYEFVKKGLQPYDVIHFSFINDSEILYVNIIYLC